MLINESSHIDKYVSIDPNSIKPLPLLPTEYKFLNNSFPNSPRIGNSSLTRSHSRSPLSCASESHLQRCKSGGENRSSVPYGGVDLWASLNNASHDQVRTSFKKHGNDHNGENRRTTTMSNNMVRKKPNEMDFKCGALCLFLPAFGKGKPVRARRVEPQQEVVNRPVISQRISLEKFECGSWRSSAFNCDDEHTSTLYFDLPLELIRTSVSDCALPMNSAFVFNKGGEVKSVLKTKTGERKSVEGRQVRFSISSPNKSEPTSPSCITPRLRKGRNDFNAFLEAQSV